MAEDLVNRDNGNVAVEAARPKAGALRGTMADVFGLDPFDIFRNFYSNVTPAPTGIEIARTENGYSVEIPVAGFAPDQIEVMYEDGAIVVSGKTERRSFTRSLMLSDDIDPDNIIARVDHGLLTLTLNRQPQAKPKKIEIQH